MRRWSEPEPEPDRPEQLDNYWTPEEIKDNLYVLGVIAEWFTEQYGLPEVFN